MAILSWLALCAIASSGCALDDATTAGPDAGTPGKPDAPGWEAPEPDASSGDSQCPFGAGEEPRTKVLFTDPETADTSTEDELRALFQSAVPGSKVRISMYTWRHEGLADEVVEAAARGVDARVVVDGRNRVEDPPGSNIWVPNAAVARLREGLGDKSVVLCSEADEPGELNGGCLGDGINHNKFALFSELCDGSTSVVFQSSANFTEEQLVNIENNSVVIRNDQSLYEGYVSYWEDERGEPRELVWTGTHNWVYSALRWNEEVILRIDDSDVFTAFARNWNATWEAVAP